MRHNVAAWVSVLIAVCPAVADRVFSPASVVPADEYPVTLEQANLACREWAGNPGLSLNFRGVMRYTHAFQADDYILESPDRQRFRVNCYTGHMGWWNDLNVMNAHEERLRQDNIEPLIRKPQSEIEQTALAFARAHYPGFDQLNMQIAESSDGGVAFNTRLPTGGFFFGNLCYVQADEFTGEVWKYVPLRYGPPTISLQPALTAAQAESIALQVHAADPYTASAFTCEPSQLNVILDSLEQERLVWDVKTVASEDPSLTFAVWVAEEGGGVRWDTEVDALTGQILEHESYLGTGPAAKPKRGFRSRRRAFSQNRRKAVRARHAPERSRPIGVTIDGADLGELLSPPVLRGGRMYWYAGYLKSPIWQRVRGRTDGGGQSAAGSQQSAVGSGPSAVGSQQPAVGSAQLGVGTRQSAGSRTGSLVIHGRTYAPISEWRDKTGFQFTWSPEKRTLVIRTRAASPGSSGSRVGAEAVAPAPK